MTPPLSFPYFPKLYIYKLSGRVYLPVLLCCFTNSRENEEKKKTRGNEEGNGDTSPIPIFLKQGNEGIGKGNEGMGKGFENRDGETYIHPQCPSIFGDSKYSFEIISIYI